MSAPLITVVIPVFNAVVTLTRAVESIQRQTLADWELIVVDDGSTDATASLLRELARNESRMRIISQPHGGIVLALNAGLAEARGQFIARMDADDESHPERLAEQASFLQAHLEVGLVGSLVEFGGDRMQAGGYALHVDWMNEVQTPEAIALNRFVESPFAHPSVMFRRDLVERHGGYRDGDFPEDYELWLRWLEAGVVMAKVPRALFTWNDPPQRLSRTDGRYNVEAFYRCKAIYLARWIGRHVSSQRRIWVWGAGRPTRKRAEFLTAHGVSIAGYIDIDPRKIGQRYRGCPVIAPDQLSEPGEVFVLGYVAKRGARELARHYLQSHSYVEGCDFLMAA